MGNCLDRNSSDEGGEDIIEDTHRQGESEPEGSSSRTRPHRHRHRHRRSANSSSNRYTRISESLLSLNASILHGAGQQVPTVRRSHHANNDGYSSSSVSSASGSEAPGAPSSSGAQPVYYLTPNVQRTADQLTETDQIKLLKRMALIQQLPTQAYCEEKKNKECAICMIEFDIKDTIKYLPCCHTFHQTCIDQWLLRSLICPSCIQPVDAGLLAAFEME